ncbi:unnamed protein product [Mytilus edulis]|uniref:Uncharacterized protein n=1 Tax=Mytilus edulis TaxID=6550 RepID=A0A8S3TDU3_MYTED|nr:unnamed protein product [Mytilus edulis]
MNILCSIVLALHVIQPNVVHANSKASLENKRLLLNDPDVTYSRLSNVEKSIQDMIGLTQQLQKQNSNMQTTIAHLEATLVKETSKRLDLQTELTKETHKTSGMQLTISQLQTELSQEKVKVSLALSHGRKYVPEESDKELQIMAMYYILNVSIRPFFIESAEIKVSGM